VRKSVAHLDQAKQPAWPLTSALANKMIKITLKEIIKNESMVKNIFTGIGYFIFTAAVYRILLPNLLNYHWFVITAIILFIVSLTLLTIFFWLIHVIRPIVQISWPDFKLPHIDEGAQKLSYREILSRIDVWAFTIIASVSILGGLEIINIVLEQAANK